MTTARERMLELSSLVSGNTARSHFLSITTSSILQIYDELTVELSSMEYEVELDDNEFIIEFEEEIIEDTNGFY